MKKVLLFLVLVPCVCGMLHSQTFDLTTGRVPVVSLDGLWRFHTGDNPAWADPSFDDSNWPATALGQWLGQPGLQGL